MTSVTRKKPVTRKRTMDKSDSDFSNWSSSGSSDETCEQTSKTIVASPIAQSQQEISDYEKIRLKAIEDQKKMFRELGFLEKDKETKPEVNENVKPKKRKEKQVQDVLKRRKSKRLKGIKDYVELSFLDNYEVKAIPLQFNNLDKKSQYVGIHVPEVEDTMTDNRMLGSIKIENDSLKLFSDWNSDIEYRPEIDLAGCDIENFRNQIMSLKMKENSKHKVVDIRIQSMHIHPSLSRCLVIAGSHSGLLGVWDANVDNGENILTFSYHTAPLNCITTCIKDQSIIYTTSHDGTTASFNINTGQIENLYATDYNSSVKHLTWHDQLDENVLLLAHGNGSVGVLDIREKQSETNWIKCFTRSCRTVQHHPLESNYFLASSGASNCCNIYDLRSISDKNPNPISEMKHPKGLTSAFFSYRGSRIVTTCNDDRLRIYDVSTIVKQPKVQKSIPHNNHTGCFLSVFKAMWVPQREDAFIVGSLLPQRRMQFYGLDGEVITQLCHPNMTTIGSVISVHPTLPIIAGGNNKGYVYLFEPPKTAEIF